MQYLTKISMNSYSNVISHKYFSSNVKSIMVLPKKPIHKSIILFKKEPNFSPIILFKKEAIFSPIIKSQNEPLFYKLNILKNSVPISDSINKIHLDKINNYNKYGYYWCGGNEILLDVICLVANAFYVTLSLLFCWIIFKFYYHIARFIMKKQKSISDSKQKSIPDSITNISKIPEK
jgi:hypothetical protein